MTTRSNCSKIIPFPVGAALIAFGVYLIIERPQEYIFNKYVAMEAELVSGSALYDGVWSDVDMHFKVYLFDVKNPDDVMEGEFPVLVEHGPYVYNMNVKRNILHVDEDADEIEFTTTRTMHFNQELSKGSEDDELTLINSGYIATLGSIQSKFPMFMPKLGNAIEKLFPDMDDIFVRGKAGDFMFGGMPMLCDSVKYPELKMICGFFSGKLPDGIKRTDVPGLYMWSFFGMLNGTAQGPFTVNRGVKNKTLLGDTTSFKGERKQRIWGKEECNRIHGTDAVTWAPMETPIQQLFTFESQICRVAIVDFKKEVIVNGLVGWRYEMGKKVWELDLFECYCPSKRKVFTCPIKGVMDLTACQGAPLYYSEPHFLHGDPALLDYAKGLSPNEEMHANFITIEPYTGAPLSGAKMMQLSAKVFKSPIVTMIANVSEGYFPMLWVQESADSNVESLAEIIQSVRLIHLLRYLTYLPLSVGIFIVIEAIVLFDVSKSDAIVTPLTWVNSPPRRIVTLSEAERLINGRPRPRFNQVYD